MMEQATSHVPGDIHRAIWRNIARARNKVTTKDIIANCLNLNR